MCAASLFPPNYHAPMVEVSFLHLRRVVSTAQTSHTPSYRHRYFWVLHLGQFRQKVPGIIPVCVCVGGRVLFPGKRVLSPHPPCDKAERQKQVLNSLDCILSLLLCRTVEILLWLPREAPGAAAWNWRERDAKLQSQLH